VACRAEVPAALELVGKLLLTHADAVVAGAAPAMLPHPEDQAPAQVPAPVQPAGIHHTYM